MNWLSTIFSAANPYLLYIKIGAVVLVAAAFAGLYEYGKYEAGRVDTLTMQMGEKDQTIADDQKNISALQDANKAWAASLAKYQKENKAQHDALNSALAAKDALDAQLRNLKAILDQSPMVASASLNSGIVHLVCMLNHATGGTSNCDTGLAPGASGAGASRTP